jgi:hypothetical protein
LISQEDRIDKCISISYLNQKSDKKIMETTKEKLQEDAARHKIETAEKKGEVAKAEFTEKVDDVKIGAADFAEKAQDKWEDVKDKASDAWEKTKDKAEDAWEDTQTKAKEVSDKMVDKNRETDRSN